MNFLRCSKDDLSKSEKLSERIAGFDVLVNQGKVKKIHDEVALLLPQLEAARASQDSNWAIEIFNKIQKMNADKSLLENAPRRAFDVLVSEQRGINIPFLVKCEDFLRVEIKRILALRTFIVNEKKYDRGRDSGVTAIKHNFFSIQTECDRLLEVMKTLRTMELRGLSKIQEVFEKAIDQVPESFALVNESELYPRQLRDFQEIKNAITAGYDNQGYILSDVLAAADVAKAKTRVENVKNFFGGG
jgi:hypothetical protein